MGDTATPIELMKLENYLALSTETVALFAGMEKTKSDLRRLIYEYSERVRVLDIFSTTEVFARIGPDEQKRLTQLHQDAEYELYELAKKI